MSGDISNRQVALDTLKSVALWLATCVAFLALTEATLRFFHPLPPKVHHLVSAAAFALAPLLARWLRRAP